MILTAWLIWGMLLLSMPVFFVFIFRTTDSDDVNRFIRLGFACILYLFTSFVWFWLLIIIIVRPEPRRNPIIPLEDKIACLIADLFYAVIGWLLCSLVKGSLIKSWRVLTFKKEKPQSIIDTK